MRFGRLTLCAIVSLGTSVALAASAPPPPPFKNIFPVTNQWAFACVCGELECSELDPITDYCVVYKAASTRSNTRAVLFALKSMVTGREPKFVVGFGLEGVKGASRAQTLIDGAMLDLPVCAEPFCYAPASAEQVGALGSASKLEGKLHIGMSSFGLGFDSAGAKDLVHKLITLPQHN
jgi:hypothetical protein